MKRFLIILSAIFAVSFFTGCGGTKVSLPQGVSSDIAVLSLGADTSKLNPDQVALLNQTLNWMDRNLMQALGRKGFQPTRINTENEFAGAGNSYLLKMAITDHKMIPKGVRFMVGMMGGADRLGVHYELVDQDRKTVLAWDDTQGSTKGGTYCAQTLNRNAVEKIANFLSNS
ncbi:MAG: hypothetical protein KKB30_02560 [Proteobacteria bacterium]|nr:hypothetical protein [Pseudomonadota bacterium]MBU1716773.1 hypothetical protein [Pseudomonadota bacterium]